MRHIAAFSLIFAHSSAWADDSLSEMVGQSLKSHDAEFNLGGAITRAAIAPEIDQSTLGVTRTPRLSMPITPPPGAATSALGTLGPATLFLSEGFESGRDALELGTFLTRGQARAGVSVTYLNEDDEVSRSEVFVDYAVSNQFSVGLSGILSSEDEESEPIRQLGVSAEFSSESGAFLQGEVSGAADYDPVIGLSIGLRF